MLGTHLSRHFSNAPLPSSLADDYDAALPENTEKPEVRILAKFFSDARHENTGPDETGKHLLGGAEKKLLATVQLSAVARFKVSVRKRRFLDVSGRDVLSVHEPEVSEPPQPDYLLDYPNRKRLLSFSLIANSNP